MPDLENTNSTINIPERLRASKAAMLVPRAIAYLIDFLFLVAILFTFNWITGLGKEPNDALALLAMAVALLYFIVAEWRWGKTVGKWAAGIVVVDVGGQRISLGQSVGRNLVRIVEASAGPICLIGAAAILFSRDSQRFGDMLADTYVVPAHLLASWQKAV
jgi:uncharacterized RDD family membrane protein YckC